MKIMSLQQFLLLLKVNKCKFHFHIKLKYIPTFHTDCLCTGYVKLSSTCLGATVQNYAMGEYEKVCVSENNTQVYQHTNSDINLYLYYEASLEVGTIISVFSKN